METAILKKWLKAGYIEKDTLHPTDEGTPQGGIISPVLANLTLDGLERELKVHFPASKQGPGPLVNLVRYADDCAPRMLGKEEGGVNYSAFAA